jgi:hypothetical protein
MFIASAPEVTKILKILLEKLCKFPPSDLDIFNLICWFDLRLEPIFDTAPRDLNNSTHFKKWSNVTQK